MVKYDGGMKIEVYGIVWKSTEGDDRWKIHRKANRRRMDKQFRLKTDVFIERKRELYRK